MRGLLDRFRSSNSGQFALMTAVLTPVALGFAAFAVDLGSLYLERRHAQSLVDIAAITAASNIHRAQDAVVAALADNGMSGVIVVGSDRVADAPFPHVVVTTGRYRADASRSANERFIAAGSPGDAVHVLLRTQGTRYFSGAMIPPPTIETRALASMSPRAAFSVGSRLAALDGGLVNSLLSGLLGSSVSLSIMDYEALLGADIDLLAFLRELSVELDLEAASFTDLLQADVTVGQMAAAMGRLPALDQRARMAAGRLAGALGPTAGERVRLDRVLSLGDERGNLLSANVISAAVGISAMDLLMAAATIAGQGKQVALDLRAQVPGLLSVSVSLAIGEPPQHSAWFSVGSGGEIVRTAQTRLGITSQIAGLGGLLGASIRLPLYLELAFAEARLDRVACPSGRPESAVVDIGARPGVAELHLAEFDERRLGDFNRPMPRSPAKLVQMPLVSVSAQANAQIANPQFGTLSFNAADIADGRIKTVATNSVVGSLTGSLLSDLKLNINVIGLGLGLPSGLSSLLGQTIGAAAGPLDEVLMRVLATLGLSIGQADVKVHGVECGRAVLVQ